MLPSTPNWSIIFGMTLQTDPQYKLRMPQEIKERIQEAAKANHRSMNAEIVARLADSLERDRDITISHFTLGPDDDVAGALQDLEEAFGKLDKLREQRRRAKGDPPSDD